MARVLPLLAAAFFAPALCGNRDASPIGIPVAHAGDPQPTPDKAKEPETAIKEVEAKIKELEGQLREVSAKDLQAKIKELEDLLRNAKARELEMRHEALKAQDLKKLQGSWMVVRRTFEGREQKGFHLGFTFRDNFTIDVSTRPKRLYLSSIGVDLKPKKTPYIYTFDDDHLIIGEDWWGTKPPLDFGSVSGNYWRLERVKGK
jgi:hypothetical protein